MVIKALAIAVVLISATFWFERLYRDAGFQRGATYAEMIFRHNLAGVRLLFDGIEEQFVDFTGKKAIPAL